jgi:hypothetical protein
VPALTCSPTGGASARFRAARNFVTNGPLVSFNVKGEPMGAQIRMAAGQPCRAKLVAEVSWRAPLERVELLQNGAVIAAEASTNRIEREVAVERSCWFAARATGRPTRGIASFDGVPQAHSSPIYVEVGGAPTLIRDDVELMIRWGDRPCAR